MGRSLLVAAANRVAAGKAAGGLTAISIAAAGAVLAGVALVAVSCSSGRTDGTLELRMRADPADLAGLRILTLAPGWAGANTGPQRDENWKLIALKTTPVELPAPDDRAVSIAQGAIPSGSYDRVFIDLREVMGTAQDATQVRLTNHVEPIARGFELPPGGRVTVELSLVVLPGSSESDGRREVFVKDARFVQPEP
jgi:hypothetical protein